MYAESMAPPHTDVMTLGTVLNAQKENLITTDDSINIIAWKSGFQSKRTNALSSFVYPQGFSVGYIIPFGWLKLISSTATPRYLNTSYKVLP